MTTDNMTTETNQTKKAPARKPAATTKAPAKAPARKPVAKDLAKPAVTFWITTADLKPVEHVALKDRKHARQIIRRLSKGTNLILHDFSSGTDMTTLYRDGGQD